MQQLEYEEQQLEQQFLEFKNRQDAQNSRNLVLEGFRNNHTAAKKDIMPSENVAPCNKVPSGTIMSFDKRINPGYESRHSKAIAQVEKSIDDNTLSAASSNTPKPYPIKIQDAEPQIAPSQSTPPQPHELQVGITPILLERKDSKHEESESQKSVKFSHGLERESDRPKIAEVNKDQSSDREKHQDNENDSLLGNLDPVMMEYVDRVKKSKEEAKNKDEKIDDSSKVLDVKIEYDKTDSDFSW